MKIILWILPAIGLVLVGAWSTHQRQSITAVESASERLQQRITAAHSSSPDASTSPASQAGAVKRKPPHDWKKLSSKFANIERAGGTSDPRAMDRLSESLESMSKEELDAALDEVAALGLPEESQETLENLIVKSLLAKAPELGMTRLMGLLQTAPQRRRGIWLLGEAMEEWAAKDPTKATAWLDQQIAAGHFDSKHLNGESPSRDMVEGGLAGVLLRSAPDAVSSRLSEMPEAQRKGVLDCPLFIQSITEETQLAFTKLVRSHLPEKDHAAALAHYLPSLVIDGSYVKVTAYMDQINATPAERSLFIRAAARSELGKISRTEGLTQQSLDTLREWTMTQAPDSTDRITGEALAVSMQWHPGDPQKFAQASEWVLRYHLASGNDDVITSFLGYIPRDQNDEQAHALAAKINDANLREKFLKKFQSTR